MSNACSFPPIPSRGQAPEGLQGHAASSRRRSDRRPQRRRRWWRRGWWSFRLLQSRIMRATACGCSERTPIRLLDNPCLQGLNLIHPVINWRFQPHRRGPHRANHVMSTARISGITQSTSTKDCIRLQGSLTFKRGPSYCNLPLFGPPKVRVKGVGIHQLHGWQALFLDLKREQ